MDERMVIEIMSGRRAGLGPALLRCALLCASKPYSAIMTLRRWAYRSGLLKSWPASSSPAGCSWHARTGYASPGHLGPAGPLAPVPVISVGNITTGGTGKTPMTAWVVDQLRQGSKSPAVLMRGYKSVDGASDEADLLALATASPGCPSVPVIVNADRVAGASAAIAQGANVLVMDDGFQHLRLRRGLDIVLIDATNPFGFGHCLPRGLLREPLRALAAAAALVVTRCDAVSPEALEKLTARLVSLSPKASIHLAVHQPTCVTDPAGDRLPLSWLAGRPVFAFCGIGNPQSFFDLLTRLGAQLTGTAALADHVHYTPQIIEQILAQAPAASAILTTQKDFVKLRDMEASANVHQLAVEMKLTRGEAELIERLKHL